MRPPMMSSIRRAMLRMFSSVSWRNTMISSIRFRNSGRKVWRSSVITASRIRAKLWASSFWASGSLPSKPSGFSAAVMFLAPTLEVMTMMVFLKSTRRP